MKLLRRPKRKLNKNSAGSQNRQQKMASEHFENLNSTMKTTRNGRRQVALIYVWLCTLSYVCMCVTMNMYDLEC